MVPKYVLIVDDNPSWLDILADILKGQGLFVSVASSYSQALEVLSISDINLVVLEPALEGWGTVSPEGLRLLRTLRTKYPAVKVLVVSGIPDTVSLNTTLEYGADAVLLKTDLSPQEFSQLVFHLLATKPRRQPQVQTRPVPGTYLQEIQIENICSIERLEWTCLPDVQPGWHVIIGDNGSGKSTLLRAIALSLVGQAGANALRQDWNNWLTRERLQGKISLRLSDKSSVDLHFSRHDRSVALRFPSGDRSTPSAKRARALSTTADTWNAENGIFSAAYGPFRRFSGGDEESKRVFDSFPRLAAHLSVFGEDIALTDGREWLKDLQLKWYKGEAQGRLLDYIRAFVNQPGFLPHQARLGEITSDTVEFVDANGYLLPVESLSDGYRSMLSMTFELIRQLAKFYGPEGVFDPRAPTTVLAPGIVLVDEIDAHLHPTWQRQVGLWLREHFPRIQFLVTTHSPLVCQAADVGTVFRLPRPGSGEQPSMIEGIELDRLRYGNVLDAYGTEAFGNVTRSEKSKELQQRLAELNVKETLKRGGLTDQERQEQQRLRAILPTSAHSGKDFS